MDGLAGSIQARFSMRDRSPRFFLTKPTQLSTARSADIIRLAGLPRRVRPDSVGVRKCLGPPRADAFSLPESDADAPPIHWLTAPASSLLSTPLMPLLPSRRLDNLFDSSPFNFLLFFLIKITLFYTLRYCPVFGEYYSDVRWAGRPGCQHGHSRPMH